MGCGSCGEIVVVTGPVSAEGAEEWWGWSTYFPSDVHPSNEWTVTTYWEQVPSLCSPPLAFEIDATVNPARLLLKTRGGMLDTTNCTFPYNYGVPVVSELSFDRWYDFVLHVRWSGDPSVGLVELWVDSVHVVPQRFLATSYIGTRTQVKQGFERAPSQVVSRIFHDAMRLGASAEDFGVVP